MEKDRGNEMNDRVICKTETVEHLQTELRRYYTVQVNRARDLKKKLEKAQWSDAVYDATVRELNASLKAISEALETLTDGTHSRIIDEFLEESAEYLQTATLYPER